MTVTASVQAWLQTRTFHHSRYQAAALARERDCSITVCVPARECAPTVAAVVTPLAALRDRGVIDGVVVIDAASGDRTAAVAAAAGAVVHQEADLLPQYGSVCGKGDAMWRALSVIDTDIVCFVDGDTADFDEHFVVGLLGPLIEFDEVAFVKAFYRRPFSAGGIVLPDGGGRVNELLARPALAMFYAGLAGVRQPLAGEVAARRWLLERIPFATGYGVEMAMLIDAFGEVGVDGLAQVDLGTRQNTHQTLQALSPMAYTVLRVIADRLERDGRLRDFAPGPIFDVVSGGAVAAPPLLERPPIRSLT